MSSVRVELGDWLKNASILGLLKVLESKTTNTNEIIIKNNYIEFDSKLLDNFEESYFNKLIEANKKHLSWFTIINYEQELDSFQIEGMNEKNLDRFNKILEDIKTKIKSNSYKSAYLLLENSSFIEKSEKNLNKIKLKKNENLINHKEEFLALKKDLKEIITYMKLPEVKRIIAAKNVMYEIIQPFWTNVSFLLKTKNKDDMYKLYKEDFIEPLISFNDKDKSKAKYNCFTCENKILKLNKPDAFDLTWLVKTGVDMSRKSSHFWNMNGDAFICPICNLIYSCLPLGFNFLKGKGIFINNNQDVLRLKQANVINYDYENTIEEIEQMSYFNIIDSMNQEVINNIDKEFDNIQVIKIDSNNGSRPYSFNILSKRMMNIVYFNRRNLESLIKVRVKITDKYYINLYSEVVRNMYEGKNLFELISKLVTLNLSGNFKGIGYIYRILEINNSIVGGKEMRNEDLAKFKNYGIKLRKKYKDKASESKIQGITYKLLNSLKTKDSSKFMDTIINSYMYMKLEIPSDFIKAMNSTEWLQSVGYSFLVGLQGERENKVNEGEVKDNE